MHSNYERYFGTSELAACTLADLMICSGIHCNECRARALCRAGHSRPDTVGDAKDTLLKWLREEI
jgi:hypothetical protein